MQWEEVVVAALRAAPPCCRSSAPAAAQGAVHTGPAAEQASWLSRMQTTPPADCMLVLQIKLCILSMEPCCNPPGTAACTTVPHAHGANGAAQLQQAGGRAGGARAAPARVSTAIAPTLYTGVRAPWFQPCFLIYTTCPKKTNVAHCSISSFSISCWSSRMRDWMLSSMPPSITLFRS